MLALASGCVDEVAGTPQGSAGFGPAISAAPTPATAQSSGPPRQLTGVDTCALLTAVDLDRIGGITGPPRRNALLPQSCVYQLAGGAAQDVAAVAFYKPLDQTRRQAPDGTLVDTDGYPTWLVCDVDDGYQSCSAAVAVHPERTLLVLLSRRDVSDVTVQADLDALTHLALSRLPTS